MTRQAVVAIVVVAAAVGGGGGGALQGEGRLGGGREEASISGTHLAALSLSLKLPIVIRRRSSRIFYLIFMELKLIQDGIKIHSELLHVYNQSHLLPTLSASSEIMVIVK